MWAMDSTTESEIARAMMESGVDFSDGLKIWGDFSWTALIDVAASFSLIISMLALLVLKIVFFILIPCAFVLLLRAKGLEALLTLLIAPVGIALICLGLAIGPYALLGFWSGLAIAGVGYAVARRIALWQIARKFPEAIKSAGFDSRFRKIFFQSGRDVSWMFLKLGGEDPRAEKMLPEVALKGQVEYHGSHEHP